MRQRPAKKVRVSIANRVGGVQSELSISVLAPADQGVRGAVVHYGTGVVLPRCYGSSIPVAQCDCLDVVSHLKITITLGTSPRGPGTAAKLLVLTPAFHRGIAEQGAREVNSERNVAESKAQAEVRETKVAPHLLLLVAVVLIVLVPCLAAGPVTPALHLVLSVDDACVRLAERYGGHSRVVRIVALRQGPQLLWDVVARCEKNKLGACQQEKDQGQSPEGRPRSR